MPAEPSLRGRWCASCWADLPIRGFSAAAARSQRACEQIENVHRRFPALLGRPGRRLGNQGLMSSPVR